MSNEIVHDELERKEAKKQAEVDGWNYHRKGTDLFFRYGNNLSEHAEEIEMNFKRVKELIPELWAPHYYLGKLFYSTKQYDKAKTEFKEALKKNPDPEKYEQPIKYCLERIKEIESGISLPKNLEEVMKMTKYPILLNHVLIEWFENTFRRLIQKVLEEEYKEDWWWDGIPEKIREKYGGRSQKTPLKEERGLQELYFIDFYDYAQIIDKNKEIFNSFMKNLKEWKSRLEDLDPIRNSIMHCRGQYLSKENISILIKSCEELQKLAKKTGLLDNS